MPRATGGRIISCVLLDDHPHQLPDGSGETLALCEHCRRPVVPSQAHQRFCSRTCKNAWHNLSTRPTGGRVRRFLRKRGLDPDAPEMVAKREAYRALGDRSMPLAEFFGLPARAARPPTPIEVLSSRDAPAVASWGEAVALDALPSHIGPVGLRLAFEPRPPTIDATRRHIHAMLHRVMRAGHQETAARFALVPYREGVRDAWSVVVFDADAAKALMGFEGTVTLGHRSVRLVVSSSPVRFKTPAIFAPGRYRITVTSRGPVVSYCSNRQRAVDGASIGSIMAGLERAVAYAGLPKLGPMRVEALSVEMVRERVEIGGHVGSMAGHCGRFVFEGNAPAVVAAKLLETTGFGGRIAYGFGRVAVTVEGPL